MRKVPQAEDEVPGAEVMALKALEYLASDPSRLSTFLALTGLAPGDLAGSAGDPAFLAGVLEYLLGNETMLIDFCTLNGIKPEEPARALRRLQS